MLDAVGEDELEIKRRLEAYFGAPLTVDISMPVWRVADAIKRLRPGWPDDSDPSRGPAG